MNQIPPLKTFHNLIHKQANFCYARLPNPKSLEYEDLHSEGVLVYYEIAKSFDPKRGVKFITYYYKALQWRMAIVLQSAYRHKRVEVMNRDLLDIPIHAKPCVRIARPFYQGLSRLAWLFVREFLDPSDKFAAFCKRRYGRETRSPLVLKRRVCEYLQLTADQKKMVVGELRVKLSCGIV